MSNKRKKMQVSIGKEAAIALFHSGFWDDKTYRQRAEFQMRVQELSMPFAMFHDALERSIGRSVWTHELAMNWEGIAAELFDGRHAPTMQEIMDLIPADKRVVVSLSGDGQK